MERLKLNEHGTFHDLHHRLLPEIRLERDSLLSVLNGYITIDIMALGKQLEKTYPQEWEYMSMSEIIEKHYGSKTVEFIEALI